MIDNYSKMNGTGLGRILKATKCSFLGFKAAYSHESAFRQELWLCVVLFPLSFIISSSLVDWILLNCALLLLLFAELVNSAIEALADSVSVEYHELLGRAKDLGSAAVFVALSILVITWLGFGLSWLLILFE